MSEHPLCRDTLSMYGLFCHVNVPLVWGHPWRRTADRIFSLCVPPKVAVGENTATKSRNMCITRWRRTVQCPKAKANIPVKPKQTTAGYCIACFLCRLTMAMPVT